MLETLLPISAAVLIFSIVASITTTQASTVANDSTLVVNTSPSDSIKYFKVNTHIHLFLFQHFRRNLFITFFHFFNSLCTVILDSSDLKLNRIDVYCKKKLEQLVINLLNTVNGIKHTTIEDRLLNRSNL